MLRVIVSAEAGVDEVKADFETVNRILEECKENDFLVKVKSAEKLYSRWAEMEVFD